jgi:crotonobetainyl-CoA:carnitine CoA-transferase CaiB-like acyl-CoA transferase
MHITTFLIGADEPGPLGSRSPFFAPYEAYRTEDGHLVVVGTGGKAAWSDLCTALGVERLVDDPRFADNSLRVRNAELLRQELEAVLVTAPTAHWIPKLQVAGVPAAPVQRLSDVLESEQVRALGALGALAHPQAGEMPIVRLPIAFSDATSTATLPPPALDQDKTRGFD